MASSQPWWHFLLLLVVHLLIQPDGCSGNEDKFLQVYVRKANGLRGDPAGATDAYVRVSYGSTTKTTPHVSEDDNPIWNISFDFGKVIPGYKLEFDVFDKDVFFDDWMGSCNVPVENNNVSSSCQLLKDAIFYYGYTILSEPDP
ncbi:perforin-1-like [Erpetoichthys calabaricus]|uniref:perforin-1-like n=1 Tax=Erpetoichthys calabaricus TaxID=27687 RepID=UPI0010A073E4|nr:perforin-1-like [Erpetoichthys calabaricus]